MCTCSHLSEREAKGRLTLACRAICRTKSGRFRSETIFATVVSTSPSRSERRQEKGLKKEEKDSGSESGNKRYRLTFAALEGDEVTFEIQRFDYDFYKVELTLTGGREKEDTRVSGHDPNSLTSD